MGGGLQPPSPTAARSLESSSADLFQVLETQVSLKCELMWSPWFYWKQFGLEKKAACNAPNLIPYFSAKKLQTGKIRKLLMRKSFEESDRLLSLSMMKTLEYRINGGGGENNRGGVGNSLI